MGGLQRDTGLRDRLARAEDAATRSAEVAIQRCRIGALAVGVVQTAIHSNDRWYVGWGAMALVAATVWGVQWGLRSKGPSLAMIGWSAMMADTVVVAAALANQLSDPTDPIDVSERRRRESELRHRVDHDGLTGIWNREALCSYVTRLLDHQFLPG